MFPFPLPQIQGFLTVLPKNNIYETFLFEYILKKPYKRTFWNVQHTARDSFQDYIIVLSIFNLLHNRFPEWNSSCYRKVSNTFSPGPLVAVLPSNPLTINYIAARAKELLTKCTSQTCTWPVVIFDFISFTYVCVCLPPRD